MHKVLWTRKRAKYKNPNIDYYSISEKLKLEKKSNDAFEIMLAGLTLEEIIALKLEIAARSINNKLYGFDLWKKMPGIVRDGLLRYAYTGTRTKMEMASFLGMTRADLDRWLKKLKLEEYFKRG